MRSLLSKIAPFIFLGIAIVALVGGIILFSYLLFFGAIVGLALFVLAWARDKLFPNKKMTTFKENKPSGRVFDHEDKRNPS